MVTDEQRDFMTDSIRHLLTVTLSATLLLLAAGCASLQTTPPEQVGFMDRAVSKDDGTVRVSAAALGADEAWKVFGANLARHGIQPVWVRIENNGPERLYFYKSAMDPTYFAPNEAAWINHRWMEGSVNRQMDELFQGFDLPLFIAPGETVAGFIHTNRDEGTKYVRVALISENRIHEFHFLVDVPGFVADYMAVDSEEVVPADSVMEVGPDELRKALEAMPCCTTNKKNSRLGDPLNIVVVGEEEAVFRAFASRKWDTTEEMTGGAKWRTVRAFITGREYRYSPISPLYTFGRRQDIALQKARSTVHERNHLRLWLTPYTWEGRQVFLGQISRDIGIRFTTQSPTISTHKIDPQVDEARDYLLEDLILSGFVEKIGFVKGVGPASQDAPRHNLTGDPYYTDGYRAVIVISGDPVDLNDLEILPWEHRSQGLTPGTPALP